MFSAYNQFVDKTAVSVTTTAAQLLTTAEGNTLGLQGLIIQPAGDIYIGGPSVTTATGIKISTDQILDLTHTKGREVWAIAASTVSCRILLGVV